VLRLLVLAIAAIFRPKALLIAENLCLRQHLVALQRHPRPRLTGADRRFWILASRWFSDWRHPLLIVKPETVLGWQRAGWKAYWRWRSSHKARGGRPAIPVRASFRTARVSVRGSASAAANPLCGGEKPPPPDDEVKSQNPFDSAAYRSPPCTTFSGNILMYLNLLQLSSSSRGQPRTVQAV
jgi:hypothetical protein